VSDESLYCSDYCRSAAPADALPSALAVCVCGHPGCAHRDAKERLATDPDAAAVSAGAAAPVSAGVTA
jgi:hypothetical protein